MSDQILLQLRDIHAPINVPAWPLALGWQILFVGLALFAIFASVFLIMRYLKHRRRRYAMRELAQIETLAQSNTSEAVAALSILLRRTALAAFPREQVAGLTGQRWLTFLDENGQTNAFSHELSELLSSGLYGRATVIDLEDFNKLYQHTRQWIRRHV